RGDHHGRRDHPRGLPRGPLALLKPSSQGVRFRLLLLNPHRRDGHEDIRRPRSDVPDGQVELVRPRYDSAGEDELSAPENASPEVLEEGCYYLSKMGLSLALVAAKFEITKEEAAK